MKNAESLFRKLVGGKNHEAKHEKGGVGADAGAGGAACAAMEQYSAGGHNAVGYHHGQ